VRKLASLILSSALAIQGLAAVAATGDGIPVGAPDPVTNVTATIPDTSVTDTVVSWTVPASDGGSTISGYSVTAFTGANYDVNSGAGCTVAGAAATSCTVIGLAFNTSYKFSVIATNSVGSSTPALSAALSTPFQTQTVTIDNAPATKTFGDGAFQLSATATSGLPVTWSSGNTAICTIDNVGFVSILTAGNCVITATQDGSGSSFAPASASATIAIGSEVSATIGTATNVQATSATIGATVPFGGSNVAVQFCVVTTNSTANCTAPAGVSISTASPATITSASGSATSANVSGLARGVSYFFFVIATSGGTEVRSETGTFTTPVNPTLTLSGPVTGQVNQAFSTTVTASSGSGVYPTWSATGLPAGLTLTPAGTEATISGTPTVAGSSNATINVTDSLGQSATLAIEISITAATPPTNNGGGGGGGGGGGDTADEEEPAPGNDEEEDKPGDGEDKPGDSDDKPGDKPGDDQDQPGDGNTGPVVSGDGDLPNPNPGNTVGTVGGSPITITQSTRGDSLQLSGGGVTAELTVKVGNQTIKLTQGTQLNLQIAGTLGIAGTGFDPNSNLIGWLYSPQIKFAQLATSATGVIAGSVKIPSRPYVGSYVLQLVGLKAGKQIVFSIGVNLQSGKPLANAVFFKNGVKLDKWELRKVTKYRKAIKSRATFTCVGYINNAKPTAVERKQARDRAKNLCAAATKNLRPAKVKTLIRQLVKAPAAKKSSNRLKLQRADLQFKNPA
jgi:hypothetical protein